MDASKIRIIQRGALRYAKRKGYAYLADDFSQYVLLIRVETPDRKVNIPILFIDFLRRSYGSYKSEEGLKFRRNMMYPLSLDKRITLSDDGDGRYHDIIADPKTVECLDPTLEDYEHLFETEEDKAMYRLFFKSDHTTNKSIGEVLGFTKSRVSRQFTYLKNRIVRYHKKNK